MAQPGMSGGQVVRAIEAIYDAAPAPERWPEALAAIADCFDDVGAIMIWQRDDGGFGTVVSPSLIAAAKDYQENRWDLRDLPSYRLLERWYLMERESVVTNSDGVTREEMDSDPFYTEFCARHGIRWHMTIAISPDPTIRFWMTVQRSPDKPEHSAAERALGVMLGRHVEKALRLSIRLFDAELANIGLAKALTRLRVGVFALDALGRVVFSNPAAQRLLGERIAITGGMLRIGGDAQRAEIELAVQRALKGDVDLEARPILLSRPGSERPLVVYLLPVAASQRASDQFLTHTRALVLMIDPKTDDPADPALVRDVLGLTLGEARVASLVATGLRLREAAGRLGITEETARTVLKRVFSKVGVSRQSELSALLTKLVLR